MQTYENPIVMPEQHATQGIGDPFVFRHNGHYYLIPSTSGDCAGVVMWMSEDMLSWRYVGNVAPDEVLRGCYAPEILYHNGTFYLVGSPHGDGHFLYTSPCATGPYTRQSDNFGLTIDGSMFADDDGQLYFTHAEYPSIHAHTMQTDGTMGEAVELCGTSMGHWTEGPGIFKRNGKHYITMTGNHLLSRGYRVDYAISESGPLGPYHIPKEKTILVNTSYEQGSLGHSSNVIGPDLDSYWIFYHSFPVDRKGARHGRFVHMDRLLFVGDRLLCSGPTNTPCPAPEMPDFYGWADEPDSDHKFLHERDAHISQEAMGEIGTAEVCLVPGDRGEALFAWRGAGEGLAVCFGAGHLTVRLCRNGACEEVYTGSLPRGFCADVLHTVRLEAARDGVHILLDHMLQASLVPMGSLAGRIGARGAKQLSYCAYSNKVGQQSDRLYHHAVPGAVPTALALPESGGQVHIGADGAHRTLLCAGEELSFRINAAVAGKYLVQAVVSPLQACEVAARFAESEARVTWLPTGTMRRVELGTVQLTAGIQTASLYLAMGEALLESIEIFPHVERERADYAGLELCKQADKMEGDCLIHRMEGLQMDRPGQALARFGSRYHTDGSIETDMRFRGEHSELTAGIFLRVSENSNYVDQVQIGHRGYYIGFDTQEMMIWRMNFDKKELWRQRCPLTIEHTYRLCAVFEGRALKVFVDGAHIATVQEDNPLPYGLAGVGSFGARVTFERVAYDLK